MKLLVKNEIGREMEINKEDYQRLIDSGLKLRIVEQKTTKGKSKIYTAVAGDYPIKRKDIKCFGDEGIFKNGVMEAKRYKVLPHQFFKDDITIWIDGNIYLKVKNEEAIDRFLGDADIAIFKHPYRPTVWHEFNTLREQERFQIPWLQKQLSEQQKFYEDAGLPKNTPLWECNFIIRRNNEKVNRLMDAWWSEICRWQWRDQVSFPYVVWKYGKDLKINTITEGNIRSHKCFKYVPHN